jgi:S-adenosylmethionine uptake transporter
LFVAAGLGLASLMLLSWAYRRAQARTLIPVEYTAFIWAALLGWLIFSETLSLTTLVGTSLIVVGCLVAARQHVATSAKISNTGNSHD